MIVNPAPSQYEGFSISDPTGTESVVLQGKAASWVKTPSEDEEECGTKWILTCATQAQDLCRKIISTDASAKQHDRVQRRRRRPRRVRRSRHTGVGLL